jgi:hypothetical protein
VSRGTERKTGSTSCLHIPSALDRIRSSTDPPIRLLSAVDTVLLMAKRRESILTAICIGSALVGLLVTLAVMAIFGIQLQSDIGLEREWDNRNLVLIGGALAGAALGGWIYNEVTESNEE